MNLLVGSKIEGPFRDTVDVVVVGSGAGGANTALRLAEKGLKVLVLEYGGDKKPQDFSQEDAVALPMLYHESGMRLVSGDANFPLLAAKTLGGSTVVNSGICFRSPRHILDGFVRDQGIHWAEPDVIDPLFGWVESYMKVAPNPDHVLNTHNLTTRSAYQKMGWHVATIPRNAPTCVGCGVCNWGCPSGGKYSVDKAQIVEGMERGMRVLTRARVDRIRMKKGVATGVEGTLIEEDSHTERGSFSIAARAVVVCAGAIDTPLLLQRSGLGGPDEGIGRGLKIHPPVGVFGYFPDRRIEMWNGVTQGIYSDQFMDEGILLESAASIGPAIWFGAATGLDVDTFEWMRMMPHLALSGCMIHDEGEGTVKNGPFGKATIKYHYAENDIRRLRRGMMAVAEAYFTEGAAAVIPGIKGGGPVRSMAELERTLKHVTHASQLQTYASHPQATVRIHQDPKRGPVSPQFNLHKAPNVFVADASIFPDCLGVNPQITIMAAARLAGDYVAETL